MLKRWLYVSASRLIGDEAEDRVGDIVKISIARNQSLGVTGALLFTGRSFAQYIEGEAVAIEALKASILRDARHSDVRTLALGDYAHRRFVTWSLAYAGPSQFVASVVESAMTDALHNGQAAVERLAHLLSEFSIGGRS
ncbi:BLUF domain-containing protein [Sphingobium sp.]|uniref:BLUF domain-containing protein n=1 Tax=Sphingobium sp. TaxID=1912891 RepID=UPI0035C6CC60